MSGVLSATPGVPGPEAVPGKVFRSELNPVDFLRRAAYIYPEKAAVVRRRAAVLLPRARRALLAARQRAAVGGARQGRSRRHAAVQFPGDARGAFRRARGGRDPGRGQQPPGQRRGRLHPAAQRRAVPAARRRRSRRWPRRWNWRRDRGPLRRTLVRPGGRSVRGVPGRRLAGEAGELARARGGDDLDQLHLRAPPGVPRGCSTPTAART